MTKTIWKYNLEMNDWNVVWLPIGSELLTVQVQGDKPCLWALVNPTAEKEERHIEIFGTGHDVPCDMGVERKYINTFQMLSGQLIFHAFERTN